jgi:hypothetical protein
VALFWWFLCHLLIFGNEFSVFFANSVCDFGTSRNEKYHVGSHFENQVRNDLKKEGLIVDTQTGVCGYKIDLAVYDT